MPQKPDKTKISEQMKIEKKIITQAKIAAKKFVISFLMNGQKYADNAEINFPFIVNDTTIIIVYDVNKNIFTKIDYGISKHGGFIMGSKLSWDNYPQYAKEIDFKIIDVSNNPEFKVANIKNQL